jgi:hypothetical protein
MTLFRRLAAALCAALCLTAVPASATNYSIDFTDLWYIPAESGWGFNVIQQGNTLFGTLFVYGNDQSARWYVASSMTPQTASAGQAKFGGKLYQTTGPFFGALAFNPTQVAVTEVGDISITFLTSTSAVLVYNVGATSVTKSVTRQTFALNTPAGQYQGGIDAITSACATSSQNGGTATFLGFLLTNINAQSGVTMQLNYLLQNSQGTCNFNGTYSQQGRLGSITGGQWSCSFNGSTLNTGTYSVSSLDIQVTGMTGVFSATDQFCTYSGRIGGIRTTNN